MSEFDPNQSFVIELDFAFEGGTSPSFRQLEALFERLDQAVLRAAIATEPAGAGYGDPAQLARDFLQGDEGSPRVIDVSWGSIRIKVFVKRAATTAAAITAIATVFHATDKLVVETTHLVEDVPALIQAVESAGEQDERGPHSDQVLQGQGIDPSIGLVRITFRPQDD